MKASPSFALFKERNFRIFWTGQTCSWLGCVMQSVAQGWLVWSLTRSAGQLALTALMTSLPLLLFSLPAGLLADRVDRRSLLLTTQALALIPALLLGTLTACAAITAPLLLVLTFLQGTVNAFEVTARQAFLAELVPHDALNRAVALNAVSFNATRMLAPVLAGLTIAAFGAAPCFFINALTFLAAVAALILLRPATGASVSSGTGAGAGRERFGSFADLREGLLFVLNHGEVGRLLLLVALVSLLGIPFVPLLPVFADSLQVGARGLGVMSASAGAGSLLAAVALALTGEIRGRQNMAAPAAMLFAAALLVFSRSGHYRLSLFALFLAGGALVTVLALVSGALQRSCPDRLRGRIMGAYSVALLGMAPLGSALMAGLAPSLGAAGALSLTCAVCLAALVLLQGRDWWRYPGPAPALPWQGRRLVAASRAGAPSAAGMLPATLEPAPSPAQKNTPTLGPAACCRS
jgi:transmembrane secretion effector